jgi:Fic family protein
MTYPVTSRVHCKSRLYITNRISESKYLRYLVDMQGPPARRNPPILFTRPTHEWLSRVDQRQKQLAALELSREQAERLTRRNETEFAYSTLRLEGLTVSREQVVDLVSSSAAKPNQSDHDAPAILEVIQSLRMIEALIQSRGRETELSSDLLLNLNPDGSFRTTAGNASRAIKPEHLPAAIEGACRWYSAESFAELHPVEQTSIVLLRLIEIQPFENANERTALLAASLFSLRRELPPINIAPELETSYRAALDEGSRMNTKPMVELIAEALERMMIETLDELQKR